MPCWHVSAAAAQSHHYARLSLYLAIYMKTVLHKVLIFSNLINRIVLQLLRT